MVKHEYSHKLNTSLNYINILCNHPCLIKYTSISNVENVISDFSYNPESFTKHAIDYNKVSAKPAYIDKIKLHPRIHEIVKDRISYKTKTIAETTVN